MYKTKDTHGALTVGFSQLARRRLIQTSWSFLNDYALFMSLMKRRKLHFDLIMANS